MKIEVLEKFNEEIEFIDVVNMEFNEENLEITISINGYKLDIRFEAPVGFRVLDEGDLLEFWPQCSSMNGWLYKIINEGWFEQESKREGFLSSHRKDINEYFIIGSDYCVSVLSVDAPDITESIR